MVMKNWFFDAILYVYALSLMFTFSDFVQRNPRAKRMGTGLLAFIWILQTFYFINEMIRLKELSLSSMFDSLFLLSWFLVTLSIIITIWLRIDLFLFIVNLISFIITVIAIFNDDAISPISQTWEVRDELLFIHVSLAIGSYSAFFFSALCSGMLLFLHAGLKNKQWSTAMRRMPSLEQMQRYAVRAVMIGTPLLLLSFILGIIWICLEKEWVLLSDIKVITSLLILILYCVYLWKQIVTKAAWSVMAMLNLFVCILVILSYMTSSWWSGFH